jgi:hypothetical protein
VFTFRDIPDSCSSGTLTTGNFTDTTSLTGPVTQKKFWYYSGLDISPGQGSASKSGKRYGFRGRVPYYFDEKSGKSFNILGRPQP